MAITSVPAPLQRTSTGYAPAVGALQVHSPRFRGQVFPASRQGFSVLVPKVARVTGLSFAHDRCRHEVNLGFAQRDGAESYGQAQVDRDASVSGRVVDELKVLDVPAGPALLRQEKRSGGFA